MASKLDIINMALVANGADIIESIDEEHQNARRIKVIYDPKLKAFLRSHPFNFAKKETALSQLTTTPLLTEYLYVYALPSDYLSMNKTSGDPHNPYKIKGGNLYSNLASIIIEYTAFITDTEQWDPSFADAFAGILTAETCYVMTGNRPFSADKAAEAAGKVRMAKNMDSMEETPDEPTEDEIIIARN